MIPIKGYATFHPLKHCVIGSGFKIEWFEDLPISKNKKIMDPLKRIAEETEQDYQQLEQILKSAGVSTYRSFLDMEKFGSLKNVYKPPVNPRDHFAVIGEKLYCVGPGAPGYSSIFKQVHKSNIILDKTEGICVSTANIVRLGKDLLWDVGISKDDNGAVNKFKKMWQDEGFRVHMSHKGYHTDSTFTVVKPGLIVSLYNIQDHEKMFPNWDVHYVPDLSAGKSSKFGKIKEKVGGRWWLKGEEHNDELIDFINIWLTEWVGYVEETVFDVNMLSIDENTIICNNHNKEVFAFFKKHKVEPIIFNFRHRHFWDGGVHCLTQDLYREGKMEDYFV